jgi:DNA-binding XRE family transcriptional regulator
MTPAEYAELRRRIGTQRVAADALGVSRETVANRERGDPRYPIGREAELAIRALARGKRRRRSSHAPGPT